MGFWPLKKIRNILVFYGLDGVHQLEAPANLRILNPGSFRTFGTLLFLV